MNSRTSRWNPPRQRRLATVGLALAGLLLAATSALAYVGPPVEVRLLGEPRAAVSGELFTGEILIASGADAEIRDLRVEGAGWQAVRLETPVVSYLTAGAELIVPFAVRPTDTSAQLTFAFEWNEQTLTRRFDLSAAHLQRVLQPRSVSRVPADLGEPFRGVDTSLPRPEPAAEDGASAPRGHDDPDDQVGTLSRDIRVWGQFAYMRSDYAILGGDGIVVRVMDDDPFGDDELGSTITDTHGYFDITVTWDQLESQPDLYVEFEARNSEADVQDDTWGITYRWRTETQDDYTGSNFYVDQVWPEDESEHGAVHIMTDLVRSWRWYVHEGYDCSEVDVYWPHDGDVSYYTPDPYNNIHITDNSTWSEETHSHEYTHHFVDDFANRHDPEYCNPGGFCDDGDDCGHCVWCRENTYVTWSEGIAEYAGHTIPDSYLSAYGRAAQFITGVDGLHNCGEDGTLHDPLRTEGFFAAVLVDLDDADHDDHSQYPGYTDRSHMGNDEILDCVDSHHPMSAMEFLSAFLADNSLYRYDIWETAMNCGYDLDEEDPEAITLLWSSSHSVSVPSGNNIITMHWSPPVDDASGPGGYAISFTHSPQSPGFYQHIGNVTEHTSDELEPGSWYFNIRPKDRAGNWCDEYTSHGPLIIREPEPSDLEFYLHAGWDYPLVPRSATGATIGSAHVTATLPGDANGTYWNTTGRNAGESATSYYVVGRVYVDDVGLSADNYGYVDAGEAFHTLNRGPFTVRGGRHVLHCEFDPNGYIPEMVEWNNDWGHQLVWTPQVMVANEVDHPSGAGRHPGRLGSRGRRVGSLFNLDGLHMYGIAWWNAVVAWTTDPDEIFSIALFMPHGRGRRRLRTQPRTSLRGQGRLNALIVNQNEITNDDWDVGVANWSPLQTHDYKAVYRQNGGAIVNYDLSHAFVAEDYFTIKEFYVDTDEVGSVSLFVETDPPYSPLHVQWRDEWFTYGDLLECTAATETGADGRAYLQMNITENGYNSLVFFRDPIDGGEPVTVHYRLELTPPDFETYTPTGWHSAMVPRPAYDGTPFSVPLPDTLYGDALSTHYNIALRNDSPGAGSNLDAGVYLDGQLRINFHYTNFPAYATSRYNYPTPQTVTGGRHTLALVLDPDDELDEISETNNIYGEQYCWSPRPLNADQTLVFVPAPPKRMDGWDQVRSGEALWFNNHGYRMVDPDTWWTCCAVMPADTSNVDVRLHEALVGTKDGFTNSLVYSGWGVGQSDYVVMNHNVVPRHEFDAAVLNISGAQSYIVQYATETYLGGNPDGIYGPYSVTAPRIVTLHEMQLPPGRWSIDLQHLSGNVDWGIGLHADDQPYVSKSATVEDGAAWTNGIGEGESIVVDIEELGYYLLGVWKVGSYDLFQTGTYQLEIHSAVTAVDPAGELPAVTALQAAYPNPFNPRTTLAFDLATPELVEIAIYDLAGARVRTLVHEQRPAGRHTVMWNGRTDRDQPVANGVYVARMVAGDVRQMQKLTLIK